MDRSKIETKRVFAIVGHAQTGKTTLSEYLLFKTKGTNRLGKVEEGTTVSDFDPEEIERKSSINASFLFSEYKNCFLQFIDTPGYLDFIAESIASLKNVDASIMVLDAQYPVEVGTEKMWELIQKFNLPCVFFINKLDKENTDFSNALNTLKENLTKNILPLYIPIGKEQNLQKVASVLDKSSPEAEKFYIQALESIAETDDALLEKYLGGEEITSQELKGAFKKAFIERKVYPV
ncbi:MAG: hypothetical protein B6D55_07480, partial [Candidatus Omnitrophica bacterium 4484_70.2]